MNEIDPAREAKAPPPRLLYCHCAYALVVPDKVKLEVLERLVASGTTFEAVADLCELSARRDPSLKRLAACSRDGGGGHGSLKIAACYPRAVKWLFAAAGAPLSEEKVEVRNMRTESAADIVAALLGSEAAPGSPAATAAPAGEAP